MARRDAILNAALTAASAGGFDGVHVREVADGAGLAASSLYRHFSSKTHLLVSVLAREFERIDAEFEWHIDGESQHDRLKRMTATLHDEWVRQPHLTDAMVRAFLVADSAAAEAVQHAVNAIEDMLARALGGPVPTDTDRLVAGVLTDVWLANLAAVIGGRITAGEGQNLIDRATERLLAGRA